MKDAERDELAARALRANMSQDDRARFERLLAADPAFRASWQAELALERALDALPDAPVSSNFTSRVVQLALREKHAEQPRPRLSIFQLLSRLAIGTSVVALVTIGALQQRQSVQRKEVAETVNAFHDTAAAMAGESMPSTEVLANFDTIKQLPAQQEAELDLELLLALQR